MLKKFATTMLAVGALSTVALAGGAPASAAPEAAPSSAPVTAMAWHRSAYYPNAATCVAVLAVARMGGGYTMPGTGPCYTSARGHFFWYWG